MNKILDNITDSASDTVVDDNFDNEKDTPNMSYIESDDDGVEIVSTNFNSK